MADAGSGDHLRRIGGRTLLTARPPTQRPPTLHLQDQFPSMTPTATQLPVPHSPHPHKTLAVARPFPPRDPHRHTTPATHTKTTTTRSYSTQDAHRRTTPIAARRSPPGNPRRHTTPRPARLLRPQDYRRRTPASDTRQAPPRCSHRGTASIAVRPSPPRNPYPRMIPTGVRARRRSKKEVVEVGACMR